MLGALLLSHAWAGPLGQLNGLGPFWNDQGDKSLGEATSRASSGSWLWHSDSLPLPLVLLLLFFLIPKPCISIGVACNQSLYPIDIEREIWFLTPCKHQRGRARAAADGVGQARAAADEGRGSGVWGRRSLAFLLRRKPAAHGFRREIDHMRGGRWWWSGG